ncbi:hypothetical protein ElyMa_002373700 [Elysia marginata]|uniref:ABC transmembrane type-1 domain-containing protein n=1 Tax=Elysia marginata TaxID=1093978 RepID=A0AAV4GEL1_9GAST|nr:hypothetical protein ElyMa_002373700 [Elysia marginata]
MSLGKTKRNSGGGRSLFPIMIQDTTCSMQRLLASWAHSATGLASASGGEGRASVAGLKTVTGADWSISLMVLPLLPASPNQCEHSVHTLLDKGTITLASRKSALLVVVVVVVAAAVVVVLVVAAVAVVVVATVVVIVVVLIMAVVVVVVAATAVVVVVVVVVVATAVVVVLVAGVIVVEVVVIIISRSKEMPVCQLQNVLFKEET